METIYNTTLLISILTFALSTSCTPGPNNIMLLSSGLTFGYKKSLSHIAGIAIGFPIMIIFLGLGLGLVFERFPIIFTVLKVIGILYLLYMAYIIASNKSTYEVENTTSKPFTFMQAALFQWVNPKAWIMGLSSISIFVTNKEDSLYQVLIIALIYFIAAITSTNLWTLGGVLLKNVLKNNEMVHKFNILMAVLLVVSIIPVILE